MSLICERKVEEVRMEVSTRMGWAIGRIVELQDAEVMRSGSAEDFVQMIFCCGVARTRTGQVSTSLHDGGQRRVDGEGEWSRPRCR